MLKNLESSLNQDESDDPPTQSGGGFAVAFPSWSSLCEGIRNGEHIYVGWLRLG